MSNSENNSDNQRRPFQGLRSFEEKNKAQFGGRDTEIKELFSLVEDLGLTVVFGKSGIGKTSLLQAGLLPELRKKFYYPTYIRIDYSSSKSPLQQVKDLLYASLAEMDPSIPPMDTASLWEYMHDVDFMKGLVTPVLILDQFEEIFTLGEKNSGVKELVAELADLVENRIPGATKEKYKSQGKIVPSRYNKLTYRVVLSLREDYLARLEELKKYIPSIMDNRLRVVQMTISQAMDAAMKPAQDLISTKVAEEIIKILPGVSQSDFDLLKQKGGEGQKLKVEPFLLSLICDRINEKRIEKNLDVITSELVSEFNVADVISSFYNESTSKYGKNVEHAIEDLLLTEGGFRKLQALGEMQRKYDISDDTINELVSARIIRKEARDGVAYVELIHDVLAPVIKEKRDTRIEEENERKRLEVLRLERAKNRRLMIRIGSVMGILLLVFIGIAGWQQHQVSEIREENARKERARKLIISAVSESIYEDDFGNAALLSKLAYGIYKRDRNDNLSGVVDGDWKFYRAMMSSSFNYKNNPFENGQKFHAVIKPYEREVEEVIKSKHPNLKNKSLRATALTPMIDSEDYGYLVALRDNTVRKLSLDSKFINFEKTPVFEYLNSENGERISSMDFDFNRNLLAIAKKRTIYLYDKDLHKHKTSIVIPDSSKKKYGESYIMKFMADGSLILALGKNLYRWDTSYDAPTPWSKMTLTNWVISDGKDPQIQEPKKIENIESNTGQTSSNKTKSDTASGIKNAKPIPKAKSLDGNSNKPIKRLNRNKSKELKVEYTETSLLFPNTKIRALARSVDGLIAIALDEKLILIDDDQSKIHEIVYGEWRNGGITALAFDPNGEFLVLGAGQGSIYKIEIPKNRAFKGVHVEKNFAHSKKVTDITFRKNKNQGQPPLLATASQDGSVAIWDTDNWGALSLDSALFGFSEKAARKISFSKGGGYLLAAYDNGNIIRWPSSLDKIDRLICEEHGVITTKDINGKEISKRADLKQITKDKHNISPADSIYYRCQ